MSPPISRFGAALFLCAELAACSVGEPRGSDRSANVGRSQSKEGGELEWFVDRADDTGLRFTHFNGMSGQFYQPEVVAPGVAMFDYDNDGDLDIFLIQGQMLGVGKTLKDPPFAAKDRTTLRGRLYRSDLKIDADGTPALHFTDVTEQSGIDARGYGMGVATGDFNNDGCIDLYLTNFGQNQLYRNNCDGTFTDVSKQSGVVGDAAWSVSASFLDFDRDGWLDLFVCGYLDYTVESDKQCHSWSGERDYCVPNSYRPAQSRLYHNNRNGTFTDVTARALVGGEHGPALGVVTADFNGDGWADIYVANDGQPNSLWINQHDGTFKNTAVLSGVALNADGKATASMGVDAGDFDGDGKLDILVTNLTGEGLSLFVNDGTGSFEDDAKHAGLFGPSLQYTGFGTAWFDFDNDGWLDIMTANGAVRTLEALARARDPFPLHQQKQLFHNLGNSRFEDITRRAGQVLQVSAVSRGAAFGDIDNDGDTDVLVGNDNGKPQLLINNVGSRNHWVGLRLLGGQTPRDMLGARVAIVREDGKTLWRQARADGSYASANDPRVLVGLGRSSKSPLVHVIWPSGRVEEWTGIPVDRYSTLKEGSGK